MSILNQLWPVSRPDFSPSFFSFHTSSADVSPGKPHRIHLSFTDSGSTITSFFLRRKEMTEEGKQPGKQKKTHSRLFYPSENSDILHFTAGFNTEHTLLKITFLC